MALAHERHKTATPATSTQLVQEISHPDICDGPRSLKTIQAPVPYSIEVNMNPTMSPKKIIPTKPITAFSSSSSSEGMGRCLSIDGGGRNNSDLLSLSSLRINVSHNLMNTLTAQIKFVGDLAERFSGRTHFENSLISINISRRPRTQRSPHPAGNARELSYSFFRKLIFSVTLPGVTDPSSQTNFRFFDFFDMRRRHVRVAFPLSELLYGFYVFVESCFIVHGRNSSTQLSQRLRALPT